MKHTMTEAMALNEARQFAAGVLYATPEMLDALTLACAVTHSMESFMTVPRLLFTSPEKETGKTTALDIVAMLSNNAWMVDPTSYALRSKFNEPETPTLLIDEISTIFGPSGRNQGNSQLGRILREGYRRSAKLSMSVGRVTEDVSSFCLAAFGGLKVAVAEDVRSRCIVFPMKRIPDNITLMPSQDIETEAFGKLYGEILHTWIRSNSGSLLKLIRNLGQIHPKLRDRRRQIWGPLFAVAQLAGEDWPIRVLAAFKALALDASDQPVLNPQEMVIRDAAKIFSERAVAKIFASELRDSMRDTEGYELYESLTDRRLEQLISSALGEAKPIRMDGSHKRGYESRVVLALWRSVEEKLYKSSIIEDEVISSFDEELG